MRLLDLPQAKHFCSPPGPVRAATGRVSLPAFHHGLPTHVVVMAEGTTPFQIQQVNVIDSVERWLAFALANFRRSVEMLVPISAPWAHVTLYYSSFFSANAILGMFGGWIGHTEKGIRAVDVESASLGTQSLRVHRRLKAPSGATGSHRVFWDVFYHSTATIAAWAPASLASALSPVNGDYAWQIAERNCVNYDMLHAWVASTAFHTSLRPAKLNSLSGPLQLQLETTQTLLQLALHLRRHSVRANDRDGVSAGFVR